MLKRTIYVESPSYLHIKNRQAIFKNKETEQENSCPVEDLGFLVIDNPRVELSSSFLGELTENNTAVIICNKKHMPQGQFTNLDGNNLQANVLKTQINADLPLKKRLWKQIVEKKIQNQMDLLQKLGKPIPHDLYLTSREVRSGDSTNREAVAARYYWQNLFSDHDFKRGDYEKPPNNYLNYGYAILRGAVSRAIVGSGLNPSLSLHHCNQYNSFSLADDLMEPYRPFVDEAAYEIFSSNPDTKELDKEKKGQLLQLLACDVFFPDKKRPLMNGLSLTTASLVRCLKKEEKALVFPGVR